MGVKEKLLKIKKPVFTVILILTGFFIYRTYPDRPMTPEQWAASAVQADNVRNKEIKGPWDRTLAAECENGIFAGYMEHDVLVWKGIPFAVYASGGSALKQAEAPAPSDRVYEALHSLPLSAEHAEGRLALNIWSGHRNKSRKKPVLVFFNESGSVHSGTADPSCSGYRLVHFNPEIILVTPSCRPGLKTADSPSSMNSAVSDHILALKWIKRNIKAFGGDPDSITIMGKDRDVSLLCMQPGREELFKKAVSMNGDAGELRDCLRSCGKQKNTDAGSLSLSDGSGTGDYNENEGKTFRFFFTKKSDDPSGGETSPATVMYYLFGSFDGKKVLGTEEEVRLSRIFQKMTVNFCLTGTPSVKGHEWPEYDTENRYAMFIGDSIYMGKIPGEEIKK